MRETLYIGARVFTGNAAVPWADRISVQGGRIRAVGSGPAAAGSGRTDVEVIDLGGRLVVPGFVDAHNHYLATAEALTSVDLRYPGVASVEDLADAIAKRAEETPADRWIRGFGMDYAKYPGPRPTRWDLDRATGDHPVIVYHVSGHYALVNSAALAHRGIDENAANPAGGEFVRDGEGRLTGLCLDAATNLILPVAVDVGSHGPNFHTEADLADLVGQLDQGGRAYQAAGLTTVCDPQVTSRELRAYREALGADVLHVRVACMPLSHGIADFRAVGLAGPFGSDALRIAGMKFYADGSLIGGTAAFHEPYGEHGEFRGSLYWPPGELSSLVREGHEAGWQIGIHAQGDRAIEMSLDAIGDALGAHPRDDPRPRIEHAGYPTPALIRRMRDLGVITVNQPSYLYESGDEFLVRLGDRAHHLQPLRAELDDGVRVVLSSDAFVASYRPLDTIVAAVERRTMEGVPIGAEQALTPAEAILAHTIEAARAVRMDDLVGSLEPGKLADFVVLDGDPFSSARGGLRAVGVHRTVQGGRTVWPAEAAGVRPAKTA